MRSRRRRAGRTSTSGSCGCSSGGFELARTEPRPAPRPAPRLEWGPRSSAMREDEMGLFDFIKGELLEVIEWTDDSRDTLSYRFPDDDKAIKNGAQLIVRESQTAQFVYLGEFGDTFGPGDRKSVV